MTSTPTNTRTYPVNPSQGSRLTPSGSSSSTYTRTSRVPKKHRHLYESGLSLKRIIGNTVTSPGGFDSEPSSKKFAYVAGAAAVVVTLDHELECRQQHFFRARPTAVASSLLNVPQTSSTLSVSIAPNESKNRSITALRESGYAPTTPGTSTFIDWSESPNSKTWSSRERIKAASCVSLSSDGKFLAVGETGYTPRVLIFSLQSSSDIPVAIMHQHQFGVQSVKFSPSGKYLASLGDVQDGFLHVWTIDPRSGGTRLHSSNKCTNFVKDMAWVGETGIVTVGTRHVKGWRIEEAALPPSPSKQKFNQESVPLTNASSLLSVKTLLGRNVVLGSLADSTFTCIIPLSEATAIICSDRGDMCVLSDDGGQRLLRIGQTGFPVTCIALDSEAKNVWIGGRAGQCKVISTETILQATAQANTCVVDEECLQIATSLVLSSCSLLAMSVMGDVLISLDTEHAIRLSRKNDPLLPVSVPVSLTAHHDSVIGVGSIVLAFGTDRPSAFFTWSASGSIIIWDAEGARLRNLQVELDQSDYDDDVQNQCQVVRCSTSTDAFLAGDKLGMLCEIQIETGKCSFRTKGHDAEILDIATSTNTTSTMMASCSRDRTIQLYRRSYSGWCLSQTIEHAASVSSLLFYEDGQSGQKLISASTDRTIQVRQVTSGEINGQVILAAMPLKIITCKSTPLAMVLAGDTASAFVVSMLDRTVVTYETSTGKLLSSFKAIADGTEAVVLDSLAMGPTGSSGPSILAGVSSTDKSVRVYDADGGRFLDREWGHTTAVTDVTFLSPINRGEASLTLISTGSDGTIMIWSLSPKTLSEPSEQNESGSDREISPPKDTNLTTRPPLRRILTKQELAVLQIPSPTTSQGTPSSPPRTLRKKTSKYSLTAANSPKVALTPIPSVSGSHLLNFDSPSFARRESSRNRSRSPPSPRRLTRRPSVAALVRPKTANPMTTSEFGSLNMATEQTVRTLRAYRKKLLGNDPIREDAMRELEHELRMTAKVLGERSLKNKAVNETVLAGLLDQYSERLVSIFDEKLKIALNPYSGAGGGGDSGSSTPSKLGREEVLALRRSSTSPALDADAESCSND